MDSTKTPYLTIEVSKTDFAKIYRRRIADIFFQPDHTICLRNEFVRVKTPFNDEWFGDFKILKITMVDNKWRIFLGEQLTFVAGGNRDKRWFQNDYENQPKKHQEGVEKRMKTLYYSNRKLYNELKEQEKNKNNDNN